MSAGAFRACAALVALVSMPSAAFAQQNTCSNVTTLFSYYFTDRIENSGSFLARGTFRIPDEPDENRQPMYNLANVFCNRKPAGLGEKPGLECRVIEASVSANSGAPGGAIRNCNLDLDVSTYDMKELSPGVLVGIIDGGGLGDCFYTTLTINRNTKRVSRSFERTQSADKYDSIHAGTCGDAPHTQMLMNCTGWAAIRANNYSLSSRICDFVDETKSDAAVVRKSSGAAAE